MKRPWYEEGLKFMCVRCGGCCGGEPGYVWVTRADCRRMSESLGVDEKIFRSEYTRRVLARISLKERPGGDCVMLTPKGCRVYELRPVQCRTWPFWPMNLKSRRAWDAQAERCMGMNHGRLYTFQEINKIKRAHKRGGSDQVTS